MGKKIAFDPTKPFGTISGALEDHPTARYEQNGCLFDRNHVHLNTDYKPPKDLSDEEAANAELVEKLNAELGAIVEKLAPLNPKVEEGTATAQEKQQHTKLTKRHSEFVEQIESIGGSE